MLTLSELAAMTEAEWLAQCPLASLPGADVLRAERKGNKARELLNSCLPNPAFVRAWAKDYEVTK